MHHDVDALEERIVRLEQELEASRAKGAGLWPWWQTWGRRVLFTFTLVAMAAPTAVWLQGRHEERMALQSQRAEAALARKLLLLDHRQERIRTYMDAALSDEVSSARRASALRYLAERLGPRSKTRQWAEAELARGADVEGLATIPPRRRCGH